MNSKILTSFRLFLFAAMTLFLFACSGTRNPPIVLRNGLVVTADGADPVVGGVIVIEDGRIAAVGTEESITLPDGATVIDLDGRAVLPGLIEARASTLLHSLQFDGREIREIQAEVYLQRPLTAGITTMRATGWSWEKMQEAPELMKALEVYGNTIPDIVMSGPSMAHSEGPAVTRHYRMETVGVGSVEEARQIASALIDLGAQQINLLMSSGPSLREAPEDRLPLLTHEMIAAIVETAEENGVEVVGQGLFPDEAITLIEAGVVELTAWPALTEPMPDALLQLLVSRSIPVLSGFSVDTPAEGEVRRFLDAGGILVFGTFAPNSRSTPVLEFTKMEAMGMTPMEMIQSATIHAARAVGLGDEIGTLEPGKQADIIVLDGNPFEEDFTVVFSHIVYLINNGELVVQP